MRDIKKIIVHCSASKDVSAATIKKWHTDPVDMQPVNGKMTNVGGRGWRDIGYHFVIRGSGNVEMGRTVAVQGAHVRGHNKDSIGICITGGKGGAMNYTEAQFQSLRVLIHGLREQHKIGKMAVFGHCDFTNAKTCPNFNVNAWYVGS